MKTLWTKRLITNAALTAAALALAPLGRAQSDKTESKGVETLAEQQQADLKASQGAVVTAVTRDGMNELKAHTLKKLAGRHLRGADAKDLGEVKDFLVETRGGSARYAVVSSGGIAGMGAKLRLVPFESLKPSGTKNDEFTLAIDKAQWELLPVIEDKEFKDGRFTITDAQRRQLASLDRPSPSTPTQASATASADINTYLIRVSDLDGRDLHSGTSNFGKIESVLIDSSGQVSALVDPKADLARANTKFIVPVSQLQLSGGKREHVMTKLTRAEFESAQQATSTTTASAESTAFITPSTTTAAAPKPATEQEKLAVAVTDTDKSLSTAVTAGTTTATTGTTTATIAGPTASNIPATTSTTVRTEDKVSAAESDKKATADQTETSADLKIAKTDDHSQATEASRSTSSTTSATVASADKTTSADQTERTGQSQDLAAVSGSKEKPSSAAGETKELTPTGRTEDKTSGVASTDDKSSTKSSATTTDLVGVDASKDSVAATYAPDSAIKGKETADPQLTPTGKQSSDAIPAGTDPALATAAQSVRKAFDDDADLSKLQITITPENGKVVLRGTVSDPMQKNAIDKKAREGANGQPIDNQIMMQKDGGK